MIRAVSGFIALALGVTLLALPSISQAQFEDDGAGPAPDLSGLVATLQATGANPSLAIGARSQTLATPEQSTLLFLQPAPPNPALVTGLEARLAAGAHIWIADATGSWNSWTGSLGAVIDSRALRALGPRPSDIPFTSETGTDQSLNGQIGSLLLSDSSWKPLWVSPESVYVDVDGNGYVDERDQPGPHVVAARRDVGPGRLTLVASTSMLTGDTVDAAIVQSLATGAGDIAIDATALGSLQEEAAWTAPSALSNILLQPAWPYRAALAAGLGLLAFSAWRAPSPTLPFRPHQWNDPELAPETPRRPEP